MLCCRRFSSTDCLSSCLFPSCLWSLIPGLPACLLALTTNYCYLPVRCWLCLPWTVLPHLTPGELACSCSWQRDCLSLFTICAVTTSCFYSTPFCCTSFLVWVLTSAAWTTCDFSLVARICLVFSFSAASEGGTINILQSLDKIAQACKFARIVWICVNVRSHEIAISKVVSLTLRNLGMNCGYFMCLIWIWAECGCSNFLQNYWQQ